MRRLLALALLLPLLATAAPLPLNLAFGWGAQSSALNLPLASSANMTFLGSFAAPSSFSTGGSSGGGAMSVNGTTMCMTGGSSYPNNSVGCFTIPTISGTPAYNGSNGSATTVTLAPVTISSNFGQSTCTTGLVITGSLVSGSTLLLTGGPYYDTSGCATGWIVGGPTNLSGVGAVNTASTTNSTYQRFFAGSLGAMPSIFQSLFGGTCYVTSGGSAGSGLSVDTSSPAGLMFSAFNCSAYNSSGGSIPLTEIADDYWTSFSTTNQYNLTNRSFTSALPLAGGGGVNVTVADCNGVACSTIPNGTTSLTLSAAFPGTASRTAGAFQIKFSDGETRIVDIGNGSTTAVPDSSAFCYYGTISCGSFPAVTGCGSGCSTTITANVVGDNYFSLPGGYEGNFGTGFFVPNTRTFRFINVHAYGPDGPSQPDYNSCVSGSGSNDDPLPGDAAHYVQLQYEDYDARDLYAAKQGSQPVYKASPYEFGAFPGQTNFPAYTGSAANSSLTWSGGTVTVTTTSPISGLLKPGGDQTTWTTIISGVTPSAYNGTYTATITGTSTFTYSLASNPGTETAAGTYTPPNYGCIQIPVGGAYFDPTDNILYMTIQEYPSLIVGEWQVN